MSHYSFVVDRIRDTNVNEYTRTILDGVFERQQQVIDSYALKESQESNVQYYGWFSEEVQENRVKIPTEHKFAKTKTKTKTTTIKSPPYTYWFRDGEKVLVTEVTLSNEITKRHKETHALYLGKLDKFCCRSYTKLYV